MFDIIPIEGGVCAAEYFYGDGVSVGLKKEGNPDVAFIYSKLPCKVGAIFTTNTMTAAPIVHFREYGEDFESNFILVNSKNANAMTGRAGVEDINEVFYILKNKISGLLNPVMSSTGVIGVRLPKDKIMGAAHLFDFTARDSSKAARAIMTTDSFPKEIAFQVDLADGGSFKIGAIAKGAGMIAPQMATMLCFITTDALIDSREIKALLHECNEESFNAISVDGDTSTNDSVILFANGASGVYDKDAFKEALKLVMKNLALMMVKDGEGAKKVTAFEVCGAKNYEEAKKAAKALSNSLLVKTALFGEDPNWGRIAATIGASQVACAQETLTISFDDVVVYKKGEILFNAEVEKKAASVMQKESFRVVCDLGIGESSYTAYGCDLGYEYVKINADYRT